jgi:hypothetical protein
MTRKHIVEQGMRDRASSGTIEKQASAHENPSHDGAWTPYSFE